MKKMINWTKKNALVICVLTCALLAGMVTGKVLRNMDDHRIDVTRYYIENECNCEWDKFEIVDNEDGMIACVIYQNDEPIKICIFNEKYYSNMMEREDS